ncbi:MAG: ribosomal L7Ae/L30e/S12e/Gadd45 family protein [Clostridiales bacterium]|nr:ribosomal L7Ae/L30e/S12e/Gadd45 family protein [Clostridiales bacterium]
MDKVISALSLSKKAGKLILGFDVVKESVQNRTAKLIVLASDVSFKTKKEMDFICTNHGVKRIVIPLKMDEIWYVLGKRAGVIAITDEGLANKMNSVISTESAD